MTHARHRDGQPPAGSSRPPTAWQILLGAALALFTVAGRTRETPIGGTIETDSERSADSSEEDAGRSADRPTAMPLRDWWAVLRRVWDEVAEDHMSIVAAGCGFYALLALFPAITALVAIYGLLADPATIEQQLSGLGSLVPPEAVELIKSQAHAVAATGPTKLSWGAALGLLLALYSATSGVKTVFEALNIAYEERETRSFIRLNLVAFLFTAGAVLGVAIVIAVIVGLPVLLSYLPLGPLGAWLVRVGSWLLLSLLILFGLALLYRFGPSRAAARWRWVTPGSLAAVIIWLAGSLAFSVYVAKFAAYNQTYGTLGGVVVLLLWLFISAFAILLGAELNAELELQTQRDTTTGAPQPMGRRRAYAADHTSEQRRR
ncbi:MAG: YihY/virulence factor BrkB family protein [Geminicoccaceae bacterium]